MGAEKLLFSPREALTVSPSGGDVVVSAKKRERKKENEKTRLGNLQSLREVDLYGLFTWVGFLTENIF